MNNPNVISNVAPEVMLAPLAVIKEGHALQAVSLIHQREELKAVLSQMMEMHYALPTTVRSRHLFVLEEELRGLTTTFEETKALEDKSIDSLRRVVKDVMKLDGKYREQGLQLIFQTEEIVKRKLELIRVMIEEVDLASSKLLTLH